MDICKEPVKAAMDCSDFITQKIAQKHRRKERARREQIEIQKQAYLEAMKENVS